MLRLLVDENFNSDIVRGLLLKHPGLDLVRAQDIGLASVGDSELLEWATENNRIVLTHDRATMPEFAAKRLAAGKRLSGVFVLNDR